MSKTPLISVLICNYNYEQYIEESLDSVIAQSYTNIEIIIIDDGSTDKSAQVIKQYISKHPEHVFNTKLKKTNQGTCYARNDALNLARGEFILFVDSDDTIPPTYISDLYNVAQNDAVDVVYGGVKVFGDEEWKSNPPQFSKDNLLLNNYINISSLVRKSKINDHQFDLNLNRKHLEDYDFWMGMSLMGLKFQNSPNTYLNYRVQSKSRNGNVALQGDKILSFLSIWNYMIEKYQKQYPGKISKNIAFLELQYQINVMTKLEGELRDNLKDLNDTVQKELIPELNHREEYIRHLSEQVKERDTRIAAMKRNPGYRLGQTILLPLKIAKKAIKSE